MLMCLAEALLRIPDAETRDRLIRDKLGVGDWSRHLGHSGSLFVNASTLGLMLTGRFVRVDLGREGEIGTAPRAPRAAPRRAGGAPGDPPVDARARAATSSSARRSRRRSAARSEAEQQGLSLSPTTCSARRRARWPMPSATSAPTAPRSPRSPRRQQGDELMARPGISIKLSALHPRYELAQHRRLEAELLPRILALLVQARAGNIAVTIDAEESERLEPSLDLFERLAAAPELAGWDGLGLAVQAYQKRAIHVIAWLRGPRAARAPPHPGAPGQGRLLGQRDQARPGAGPRRLPGVHAQARDRRLLPRLRAAPARRRRGLLSAVRDPQRADARQHRRSSRASRARLRVPAPARHGRGALRGAADPRCAGRFPAASTRRSAATRTSCPTWSGACSRTAPTPPSSTASSTESVPLEQLVEDPALRLARSEPKPNPRIPLPASPLRRRATQLARRRSHRPGGARARWPSGWPPASREDRLARPGGGSGAGRAEARAMIPADRTRASAA